MEARMPNPVLTVPAALEALQALTASVADQDLDPTIAYLVELRASQINGCSVCVQMHAAELRKDGQSEERIAGVAAWRDAPYYSDAERAALDLTEHATRLADRSHPVPDEVYDAAAKHFDQGQLTALVVTIAAINAWNRINVTTAQVAGAWTQ